MKITYTIAVDLNGTIKDWNELADADKAAVIEAAAERGSTALSAHCTQTPHDFVRI